MEEVTVQGIRQQRPICASRGGWTFPRTSLEHPDRNLENADVFPFSEVKETGFSELSRHVPARSGSDDILQFQSKAKGEMYMQPSKTMDGRHENRSVRSGSDTDTRGFPPPRRANIALASILLSVPVAIIMFVGLLVAGSSLIETLSITLGVQILVVFVGFFMGGLRKEMPAFSRATINERDAVSSATAKIW